MNLESIKPGDVVQYEQGNIDYIVGISDEDGLYVNACNPSWIEQGFFDFCSECYPFTKDDAEMCVVIDHYGSGTVSDAQQWYRENKNKY